MARLLGAVSALVGSLGVAHAGPFLEPVGSPNGVFVLAGARTVAVSPDGTNVYAGGGDTLVVFQRDVSGAITLVETHVDGIGGDDGFAGIAAVAISPDGAHVYAAGEAEDAVAVFTRTAATGSLSFAQVVRDGAGGVVGLDRVDELLLSPDGANLYTATGEAIGVFARNAGTGQLTFLEAETAGLGALTPLNDRGLGVSADGADVYVGTAPNGVVVTHFRRDAGSGLLSLVETHPTVPSGSFDAPILVPLDGTQVIAAGHALYERDPATGLLSNPTLDTNAPRTEDAAIESRGSAIYFADLSEVDATEAWWRDPHAGTRGRLERNIAGGAGVAIAPDGAHVYAAGDDRIEALRVACAPFVVRTRLTVANLGDAPGNEVLKVRGEVIAPAGTFAAIDPVTTGMRVRVVQGRLESGLAVMVLDVVLPPGAFGGKGTAGWRLDASGTTWKYSDATGGPGAGGIVSAQIRNRDALLPGQLKISLKGKNGSYPFNHFSAEPPNAQLDVGDALCAGTAFEFLGTGGDLCRVKGSVLRKFSCRMPR